LAYDTAYTGKKMAQWTRKLYYNAIFPIFAIKACGIHNFKAGSFKYEMY
jgi:hypothetical protein